MDSPGSGFAAVVDYGQYQCECPTTWLGLYPPPLCNYCQARRTACAPQQYLGQTVTIATLPLPLPQRVSNDDVERIARRVVELLKEPAK